MASGSSTMSKIERAHQMYREGKYTEALDYYTDALSLAKTKPQKIALHSNRAACYLKLHHFHQAAEECTSVLELDQNHTGALMLRAQTLVTLKEYHSALFDVNRLIELDSASEVYKNLEARLRTHLSLAPIPEDEAEFEQCDDDSMDEMDLDETEEAQDNVDLEEWGNEENDTSVKAYSEKIKLENISPTAEVVGPKNQRGQKLADEQPLGWNTIPKPKGHSHLDYSRWDRVEDDSSGDDDSDDDDDDDSQPHYRFRVKTVGVRAVK